MKIGKCVIFTIRRCFISVCNHPFLVGTLCLLIFLSKSSPFVFSLLVSASPVLVCTAVLLGTFLSFGQPNTPQIETEEKNIHESVSMKRGVPRNVTVFEQNESYSLERERKKRRNEAQQSAEQPSSSASKLGEERSGEIKLANAENTEPYEEKSEADSFDSERVHVDFLDSPPCSQDEEDEEKEDEDDALDSDFNQADIMLLFDEFHPLLDHEAPNHVQVSHDVSDEDSDDVSDEDSDEPPEYITSSRGSFDETENHEALKAVVAKHDNEGDGDEGGDKEEEAETVFTWTEEDQKNLMELGSSEIERNRRLESVILRRRARKHMSMIPEMSLIDLGSSDPPFNVAPISIIRTNPFVVPHDSYGIPGLPPVPGSAPSILLPRRLEMNSEPNL